MNPTPEQPQPPLAATRRHDVATGVSPWIMKTRFAGLAATRRHDVAMGVSPWIIETHRAASPEGTTCGEPIDGPVAPLGLGNRGRFVDHGLAPMATTCRPFGTETQFAESAKPEQAFNANLRGLGYGGEWKIVLLGDVITLQRGFDLPSQDRKPGKVPIVSSSGISDYHSEVGTSRALGR